jgi:pullulanase/glycogen debranching enzyme
MGRFVFDVIFNHTDLCMKGSKDSFEKLAAFFFCRLLIAIEYINLISGL